MDPATTVVLVLIVVFLLGFGFTCQRSTAATTHEERTRCQTWGGLVLFMIVVLMVVATALALRPSRAATV